MPSAFRSATTTDLGSPLTDRQFLSRVEEAGVTGRREAETQYEHEKKERVP
jgi:hypothetical protein